MKLFEKYFDEGSHNGEQYERGDMYSECSWTYRHINPSLEEIFGFLSYLLACAVDCVVF